MHTWPSVKYRALVCNSYFARVGKMPSRVGGLSYERFWINGTLLDYCLECLTSRCSEEEKKAGGGSELRSRRTGNDTRTLFQLKTNTSSSSCTYKASSCASPRSETPAMERWKMLQRGGGRVQ